jgi:hypothetical protein
MQEYENILAYKEQHVDDEISRATWISAKTYLHFAAIIMLASTSFNIELLALRMPV